MSLRLKTVVILLFSLLLVLGVFYLVLNSFIFTAFSSFEKVHFNKLGHQVARTIETQEHHFNSFVRDWGIWNDSFTFVAQKDQEFIDDNMTFETLDSIGTACILYLDRQLNLHYSYSRPEDRALAQAVVQAVQQSRDLILAIDLERNPSFYLCVQDTRSPFLASMHPVLPTDRSLPANGYVLMGTPVDDVFSQKISQIAGFDFTLQQVCQPRCDDCAGEDHIGVVTTFLNNEQAEMILSVRDIENHCSFKLKTLIYREMNVHLQRVFYITIAVIVILGLLGIMLVEKVLNHLVIHPVSYQIQQFNQISDSGDLSHRFVEHGSSELKLLTETANRMLDKIHALNQQLHLASETDSLTGLWNRRRFDVQLRHDWQVALRNGDSMSLLMLDVDFFKQYNDSYGHQEGDSCLQKIAETISGCLKRETDMAARYGGEEFAVILPGVNESGAMQVAERIRNSIEALQIANYDVTENEVVTISVGVATLTVVRERSSEDLVRMADQALYRAKSAGRNCCQRILSS